MRRSVTVAILLVVLVAQRAPRAAGLQDGQPVFRAGVDLVTIDVVATGANGAPVLNLRAEDFEILEDGSPQQIQTFQFVDLSSASAIRPLPPGMASNEVDPGGLFVVVLDELGLQVDDVSQARRVGEGESALPVSALPIALAPSAAAGEGHRRGIIVPFEIGSGLTDGTTVEYTVVASIRASPIACPPCALTVPLARTDIFPAHRRLR